MLIECQEVREEVRDEFSQPWHESHEVSGQPDEFLRLVQNAVKDYLDAFFFNKDMHCGGPINARVLHSSNWVSTVMNTDSESGMGRAYAAMEREGFKQTMTNGDTEDIWFMLGLLKECAKLGIPKCFRPGILLVHLELCEGISVF